VQDALAAPRVRRTLLLAAGLALLAQLAVSLPFLFGGDPSVLARHFDGPNYMAVAKTLYRPTSASPLPGYVTSPRYFAAHLPLYPLAVRAAAAFAGYPAGLLLATAFFGAASAAAWAAYQREAAPAVAPLLGVLLFLFVPPRSLLYRSIGATEAPMALFVVLAALAYRRGRTGWAFAAAALASVTRVNGVLVVLVLAVALLARGRVRAALAGATLAALPLAATFAWHGRALGDPFAFFATHSGKESVAPFGNILDFARDGRWVDAELLLGVFLFFGVAAARLWAAGDRFESGVVLAHLALFSILRETDLPRYALTVAPFAVVLAFRDAWANRRVAAAFLAVAAPLGLAYAWATMPNNVCDPAAWRVLTAFLGS
jgi:hypothetical protein